MKIRKILSRILLVLLGLVAAVLVVRAVLNFTEGRRLARALADLKAQGVPMTLKDLIAPCPEEENGATLWKAAEELFVLAGKNTKLLNETLQKVADDQAIAADARAALVSLIEKNRKALEFIPEVAGKPCFRYGDLGVSSWVRRLPQAIKLIQASRLWGFEALLAAEKGDVGMSIDHLRTGLRFAPKVAEESILIAYLIALADAKIFLPFLNRAVSGREVSAELLLPFLDDLGESQIDRWKALLKTSIRGERVMFIDIGVPLKASFLQEAVGAKSWTERFYYWLIRPLIKRDVRSTLPIYAELEGQASLSYYQTRDFWGSYKGRLESLPWYAFISKSLIPDMEATFMKVATFDALVRTSRAGLACRIFKSRTGAYPESLDALVPGLLTEVPIDPFTGKPLVYRREGEGFIVYSLGSNQKDDGGKSTWMITQLVMEKDDDWTWKESW